ncbi:MAG: hypothetical protein ACRYG7_12915 [Janthinobacterium lividum]
MRKTFAQKGRPLQFTRRNLVELSRSCGHLHSLNVLAYTPRRSPNRLLRFPLAYGLGKASARTSRRPTGGRENANRSGSGW